jgi:diamine N-acetyltransferase
MGSTREDQPATVTLREITAATLRSILELEVGADQKPHYPRSNAYSIAEAYFAPDAWFRGIYAGEIPVGFVMLSLIPERAEYFLWRLMIDRRYQRQGYGRAAMRLVIDHVRTLPDATAFYTSHLRGNRGAAALYSELGFRYTGDETDGDLLMRMSLEPA